MKKVWIALLALALAALIPGAALAAAGDAEIRADGEVMTEYNDGLTGACALDGTLYLCGLNHIFSYDADSGELTGTLIDFALDEDEMPYPVGLVSDGERLYVIDSVSYVGDDEFSVERLDLVPVEIDEGEPVPGEPLEVDADDLVMEIDSTNNYLVDIPGCCWVGGYLMLLADDGVQARVYTVDPEEGYGWYVEDIEGSVRGIAPYGEDQLLIACWDAGKASLYLYDPEEDELEEACVDVALNSDAENLFAGLAYSAESGRLFYLDGGSLMAAEGLDLESARNAASLSSDMFVQSTGILLPGDLYAYSAGYSGVFLRATQGRAEITARIVAQGTAAFEASAQAYNSFTAAHEGVEVVMNGEAPDSDALIEAMMNRNSAVDVYLLPVDSEAYDALYERGFLVELDDPEITAAVEGMYPAVRDAVTKNGAVVALPVVAGGATMGIDYEGFEKAGYAREDVPDNWPELLAMLPEVQKNLPEDENIFVFDGFTPQPELRETLLKEILNSWRNSLTASGREVYYDDPALAEALEAMLALDLDALDVPRDEDEANALLQDLTGTTSVGSRPYRLLEGDTGCVFGMMYSVSEPVPLAVVPGEPGWLPLQLTVAVVNPYSKNPELAQEFVLELLHNASVPTRYSLSDALNEPVKQPRTEQVRQQILDEIDRLEASLETADAVDAPAIQDAIDEQQRQLDSLETFGMLISQKDIDWYRAHAEHLAVVRFDYLNGGDSELDDLTGQLLSGRMKPESFLKEVDKKARMRRMEGY